MESKLNDYLSDLVSINSINPDLSSEGQGEYEIAQYVASHFKKIGIDYNLDEVVNDRYNVSALLNGQDRNKILLMNGHLDTVGAEGIENPFTLRKDGDRLYGRGTYDMLAGCAIQMCLAEYFKDNLCPISLAFTFVCDEENKSIGMEHLIKSFIPSLPSTPYLGIFMEPTEGMIGICHKGYNWYKLKIKGLAAHGSRPEEGINAIFPLQYALAELSAINDNLSKKDPHPYLGHATLHPGKINGGSAQSVIAAEAILYWERRTLPGEDQKQLDQELEQVIAAVNDAPGNHKVSADQIFCRPPNQSDEDHYIKKLSEIIGQNSYKGMSYWADSALAAEVGIPSILYGPAGHGAHAIDEWVSESSMINCYKSLINFISNLEK
tara:strand:+ start:131 stop:1267 length:1137 start_codon:yes stop_codon:yes gene_type:complete